MTGMEHAIEQATEAIRHARAFQAAAAFGVPEGSHRECAEYIARALAEAGLLAPAPMSEEWTVMGEYESGDDWVIDVEFATRLGAEDFLARNEWASDDGGYVARRLMTDWLPADEAD